MLKSARRKKLVVAQHHFLDSRIAMLAWCNTLTRWSTCHACWSNDVRTHEQARRTTGHLARSAGHAASMGPRLFPARIGRSRSRRDLHRRASMGPRSSARRGTSKVEFIRTDWSFNRAAVFRLWSGPLAPCPRRPFGYFNGAAPFSSADRGRAHRLQKAAGCFNGAAAAQPRIGRFSERN